MNIQRTIEIIELYQPAAWVRVFLIGVFIGVAAVICHYIKKDALYDFDQVMYAACVFDDGIIDSETLRKKTYAAVLTDLGAKKFAQLTDSTNYYRKNVFRSAANFQSQLPFYEIKWVYVGVLKLGHKAGISPFRFSTSINLACYILIAFLLLVFLVTRLGFLKGWLFAILLIIMPAIAGVAKLNSPDLFTGLVFTLAAFALVSDSPLRQLSPFLFALLILIRPENIIFPIVFCVGALLTKPRYFPFKFILPLGAFCLISYFVLNMIVHPYSWSVLFRHSFFGYIPDLQHSHPGISVREYLVTLKLIFRSSFHSDFSITCFILFITLILSAKSNPLILIIVGSLLASLIIRILLFPDLTPRFFTGPFVVAIVLFLLALFPRSKKLTY